MAVTIDDVRQITSRLERSYEAVVRDRVKFRVGRIVYLAFSRDDTMMGFAFPKEERDSLIASRPDTFVIPGTSDLRYNWVVVRLSQIDLDELYEIVIDAWSMVVPKKLITAHEQRERSKENFWIETNPGHRWLRTACAGGLFPQHRHCVQGGRLRSLDPPDG
jgi:hypothetical protein